MGATQPFTGGKLSVTKWNCLDPERVNVPIGAIRVHIIGNDGITVFREPSANVDAHEWVLLIAPAHCRR